MKKRVSSGLLTESISRQLIEKEINSCDPAVSGNDEISPGDRWLLTRAALYPSDSPGIAQFLRLANWLISIVRVRSPERARDAIDFVAPTVDVPAGFVEHAIFGEDLVNRRAPTDGVILTEDVLKIAGQQSGYALRHDFSFRSEVHFQRILDFETVWCFYGHLSLTADFAWELTSPFRTFPG